MAYRYTDDYIQGTSAPARQTLVDEEYKAERALTRERLAKQNKERRAQEKAKQVNLPYVLAVGLAVVGLMAGCYSYLRINSTVTYQLKQIASLQSQISTQKAENTDLQTKIDSFADLNYIKDVATNELGMVYPSADQKIYYDKTESEYVKQNEDIPTN